MDSTVSGVNVYTPEVLGETDASELERSEASVARLTDLLARAEDRAAWIQDICAALGEYPRLDELLAFVMDRIRLIMDADRATLYMLEADGEHLVSRIISDASTRELRLAVGEGIAGWVARHGVSLNVRDAYRDPRFDPRSDQETGFRTQSVICQPMRDKDGGTIGVVQVLNKRAGYFTVDDELLLSAITNTAAIVIQNRRLYLEMVDRNMQLGSAQRKLEERMRRFHALYDIHRRVAEAGDLDDVLEVVACALGNTVVSFGCSVSLLQGSRLVEHAFSRTERGGEFRPAPRNWDAAVRAHVMETGEPVSRRADVDRPDAARMTGRMHAMKANPVLSIAAVPLTVDGKTIGCVELVNRCRADDDEIAPEFSDEDIKLMDLVAAEISGAVAQSMQRREQEHHGRMLAIGHMLSGVIHDTRTPMTIASGYVQLMARTDDPEKRKIQAAKVARQFELLNNMTRELLAYARGETTLYVRTVHLHVLVEELREFLDHEFDGHSVEVSVETTWRGDVRIDDGKLKRVIFNLARNAREAMPDGGAFRVSFDRQDGDMIVRVADTGRGIPANIRTKVFEAFVTESKTGGSGLGLAIVKKLVDEHGGKVSFESAPSGTVFTIRLPLGPPSA